MQDVRYFRCQTAMTASLYYGSPALIFQVFFGCDPVFPFRNGKFFPFSLKYLWNFSEIFVILTTGNRADKFFKLPNGLRKR